MEIRGARAEELQAVWELVASQQVLPERHIAYESLDTEAIAEELTELEPIGLDGLLVAVDGGSVLGALAAEWDERPPRVWWHGPYVAGPEWATLADGLLTAGRALLPETVTQEELAADDRHTALASWAASQGFAPEEASVALVRNLADLPVQEPVPGVELRPFAERDRQELAALHDVLFPGTHVSGDRLDEGSERLVFVAHRDGELIGYAAGDRQADGTGYLDFLGVTETARGSGVGGLLVARTSVALAEELGCHGIHLTVRENNVAARRLYARLGFTEERLVRPYRRGFTLG